MSNDGKLKILALAADPAVVEFAQSLVADAEVEVINDEDSFDEKFEEFEDGIYAFVLCGPQLGPEFSNEVAQVIKCQCPDTPSFYVTDDKENFRAKEFEKNGFTKAFLYPADQQNFKDSVINSVDPESLKERHFKQVRVIDFGVGEKLGFDTHVFLPLNKKYVKFSAAAEPFSEKKAEKLEKHHIGSVHIDNKDSKAFYEYSAQRLKKIGQGDGLTATEKEEKLRNAISGLFNDIFDASTKDSFDSGKSMLSTCQKIVSNYVTNGLSDNWYANLVRNIGSQKGTYNHASEVSTFAALFAIGIGHPNPEDLALAGFLHDISLTEFPQELLDSPQEDWDEEHKKIYREHPKESVNAVKRKKMIISDKVEKAILDHHEMFNGMGFPKQKAGDMISDEAQLLSCADQFQYLISIKEGQKRLTPLEAIEKIEVNGSISPKILAKIKSLIQGS